MSAEATNDARVNVYINGQSAVTEIEKLERKILKLGRDVNRVGKDSEMGKKLQAEMRLAQAEIDKLAKTLDLTKMSIRQLESESKRLRRLRDLAEPGTIEFKKLEKELTAVNKRITAVKTGLGPFGQAWKLVWDQLKGFNLAVVGLLAGNMILNFFGKVIKGAAELSDQMADIRKTTNMTKEEVKELNQELGKIDTRTGRKELRDMAIIGGQINVVKEDLKDFVKSVDIANVALGDEFTGGAKQVAEAMGKVRNIFTDIKSDNIGDDILKISNAINELGADGFATGPVITDNANRIGGYGIQVGLTTAQVLGLSAAQQELNIESERGSTAIVRILQKMLSEVDTFATVAGVEVGEFKKMLDTDLYAAFLAVVKGSKEAGKSNTQLAKIISDLEVDGAGASEVFAKFGSNVSMVDSKVQLAGEALKSTNSIMNEFTLKNENSAAVYERIGRAIGGWFSKNFVEPADKFLMWVGRATGLIKSMSEKTAEERLQLIMMESKIRDVNTAKSDRIKLIKELQSKYPSYLGNLNAETVSNDQLNIALKKVNDELVNKIILAKEDEKIQANKDEQAEKRGKRVLKEIELQEKMADIISENPNYELTDGTIDQQVSNLLKQMRKVGDVGGTIFSNYNQLARGLRVYNDLLNLENAETLEGNNLLAEKEKLMKALGIQTEIVMKKRAKAPVVQDDGINPSMIPEKEKKEKKEFKMPLDVLTSEMERYMDAIRELNREIAALYQSDTEIAVSEATEKTDKLLEENARLQSEMIFAISFGNKQEREFAQKRLRELMIDEQTLTEERARRAVEAARKIEEAKAKAKKDALARINDELKTPLQKEIDAITAHYAELLALAEKYGVDSSELIKKRDQLILESTKAYNAKTEEEKRKSLEKIIDLTSQYVQAAQNIMGPIVQLVNNAAEKQIQTIETQTNKRIEALDRQRERGLITEEQYQKKKLAIEKKTQKEIGQQRRRQAIADRIAAQAQVVFATAEAIARAWAASVETFGAPWSIAAAVMGGLQSAAIWSAPMPTYKYGGTFGGVPDGPSHENGGISLVNSQTGRKVGEMEGGEPYMILSKEMYGNNRELIDRLLQISMYENGRRLTVNDFLPNAPQMDYRVALNAGSGRRIVNRTVEGSSSNSGTRNPIVGGNESFEKVMYMLMDEIQALREERKNPIRAYQVIRDSDETAKEYSRITQLAAIGESKSKKTTKTVTRTSSSSNGAGTTTIIQGQPGAQGPAGRNGSGLGLFQFLRW